MREMPRAPLPETDIIDERVWRQVHREAHRPVRRRRAAIVITLVALGLSGMIVASRGRLNPFDATPVTHLFESPAVVGWRLWEGTQQAGGPMTWQKKELHGSYDACQAIIQLHATFGQLGMALGGKIQVRTSLRGDAVQIEDVGTDPSRGAQRLVTQCRPE